MNIIVSGATGFIGGNLARWLKATSELNVFRIIRPTSINTIESGDANVVMIDLLDTNSCLHSPLPLGNNGCFVHCAAVLPGGDNEQSILAANTIMTLNAVVLAQRLNCKTFIQLSSIAVYGKLENRSVDESHALNAHDAYGRSKIVSEAVAAKIGLSNLTVINLRFGSPQGPSNPHKSMVPEMMKHGINDLKVTALGDAKRRQSFIDLRDLASCIQNIATNPQIKAGSYNISTIKSMGNLQVAKHIANLIPGCEVVDNTVQDDSDPESWNLNCQKAMNELHFKPKYSPEEMFEWVMFGDQ